MDELVTCKTCGSEIAKSAKVCPNCGAKNKTPHRVLKTIIVIVGAIIFVSILFGESSSDPQKVGVKSGESATQSTFGNEGEEISFHGDNYSAMYKGCWDSDFVDGCIYLKLEIDNRGASEQLYMLDDVYIDGVHCNTGSGLPVTAAAGKSVVGDFIIFTDASIDSIRTVDFKLNVLDNESLDTIETSENVIVKSVPV